MQAIKQFTQEDQIRFATASGDFNPMHMDALAARRTQAGAPVVHGMHTLLWLLDCLADSEPSMVSLTSMKVRFAKMVYIGESVEAGITHLDEGSLRAGVSVDGIPAVALKAGLGKVHSIPTAQPFENTPFLNPVEPYPLSIEEMKGRSGKLRLPDADTLAEMFPHAARCLGARRVAALACSSYLVGMVMPGLHSIYAGLNVDMCENDHSGQYAFFKVRSADARFRLVSQYLFGGGISAELETFVRMPPVRQASLETIARFVQRNEFAGTIALIVGGSRGLGELTAKVIVAGGGKAIITYARGKADAESLAAELRMWGANCEVIAYDVLGDAGTQLRQLRDIPSDIYYYATCPVIPNKSSAFSQKAYDAFHAFYVTGFEHLLKTVLSQTNGKLGVFYPSSVFVDQPPAGMSEYAKAKSDGERLCIELMAETPTLSILTSRLPRMLTDLTATIQSAEMADPLAILLPLIRESISAHR